VKGEEEGGGEEGKLKKRSFLLWAFRKCDCYEERERWKCEWNWRRFEVEVGFV